MPFFLLDGSEIPFTQGQTLLDAAMAAGTHIPHLCWDPRFEPHNSCRLCTVRVDGRPQAACAHPAGAGQRVENDTEELRTLRRTLLQMLFVDGNHVCPTCEKSGDCRLQASAYLLGMQDNHYPPLYSHRRRDDSHPRILLDLDRCILCELCVRASRDLDGKDVFAIVGRGLGRTLTVNAPTGLLRDTAMTPSDQAAQICPVGAILVKEQGFTVPIGQRVFDLESISAFDLRTFRKGGSHA
jgi:[NiFe] hydrogenase diaphorase moiety small subunit